MTCELCGKEMLPTGECWTCPGCGAWRPLEERTWVGVGCERCEAEVPIVNATLNGAPVYRNPKMKRVPLFTRGQDAEVERVLRAGVDCPRCSATLDPHRRLLIWVPPPADFETLRFGS